MESKKIDFWTILFWVILVALVIWLIYEFIKEIRKSEQDLEERVSRDTAWLNLEAEVHKRLVKAAIRFYRIVIGGVVLLISGLVYVFVHLGFSFIDSLEIIGAVGGFLLAIICATFYYRLNPEILLEKLKSTLLAWVYRRNGLVFESRDLEKL